MGPDLQAHLQQFTLHPQHRCRAVTSTCHIPGTFPNSLTPKDEEVKDERIGRVLEARKREAQREGEEFQRS